MHGQCEFRADPDDHIGKNEGTLIACGYDENDIVVLYMCPEGIDGRHMNVAFGYDDTFLQLYFSVRAHESASRCAGDISGLADDAWYAKPAGICNGYFDLGCGTKRAQ